jgi:hypothetical protein
MFNAALASSPGEGRGRFTVLGRGRRPATAIDLKS